MDYYNAISVSQLNKYLTRIIASEELLVNIAVEGELSSFKVKDDVAFFTLKDSFAILNCVMFDTKKIKEPFVVGDKVYVRGSPSFYGKSCKLNFNVNHIEKSGEGEIYKNFLILKQKLLEEGLFDTKYKKIVPNNATNIGVVTSTVGAVIQDIINVATRRNNAVNLIINDCKVQGENADLSIMQALAELDLMNLDVIIIARGGGSYEDLSIFNSERLARFVIECKTPIVSAVGHETDFTILDFVASLRAPTPSAAAELVVSDVQNYKFAILNYVSRLSKLLLNFNENLEADIFAKFYYNNSLINQIISKSIAQINLKQQNVHHLISNEFNLKIQIIQNMLEILKKINPVALLENGYATLFKENIRIKSIYDVNIDENIRIELKDGLLNAKITSKESIKR